MGTVETIHLFNFLIFLDAKSTRKKDIVSDDETPPLSPSLLINDQPTEATAQQQSINIRKSSPVPRTEQENLIECPETLHTPPRRHSSCIQQTSKSSSKVSTNSSCIYAGSKTNITKILLLLQGKQGEGGITGKSIIYTDTPEQKEKKGA